MELGAVTIDQCQRREAVRHNTEQCAQFAGEQPAQRKPFLRKGGVANSTFKDGTSIRIRPGAGPYTRIVSELTGTTGLWFPRGLPDFLRLFDVVRLLVSGGWAEPNSERPHSSRYELQAGSYAKTSSWRLSVIKKGVENSVNPDSVLGTVSAVTAKAPNSSM